MTARERPPLTTSELDIMQVIWEHEQATINDVVDTINAARDDTLARTTIQVQMNRLEEKGWLTHQKVGRTFQYQATNDRQSTLGDIVADIAQRAFRGSGVDLVKALFERTDFTPDELKRLRQLIDDEGKGGEQ